MEGVASTIITAVQVYTSENVCALAPLGLRSTSPCPGDGTARSPAKPWPAKDGIVAPRKKLRPPGARPSPSLHPLVADLLVNPLHRRPGDAEGRFLLPGIVRVGGVGVVEGLAKNVLRMLGQVRADRGRQIGVDVIR